MLHATVISSSISCLTYLLALFIFYEELHAANTTLALTKMAAKTIIVTGASRGTIAHLSFIHGHVLIPLL